MSRVAVDTFLEAKGERCYDTGMNFLLGAKKRELGRITKQIAEKRAQMLKSIGNEWDESAFVASFGMYNQEFYALWRRADHLTAEIVFLEQIRELYTKGS